MPGKGKEGATHTSSTQGASFTASRLSARLGWNALEYVARSALGQENVTEVSLYLHYGEEQVLCLYPGCGHF